MAQPTSATIRMWVYVLRKPRSSSIHFSPYMCISVPFTARRVSLLRLEWPHSLLVGETLVPHYLREIIFWTLCQSHKAGDRSQRRRFLLLVYSFPWFVIEAWWDGGVCFVSKSLVFPAYWLSLLSSGLRLRLAVTSVWLFVYGPFRHIIRQLVLSSY